MGGRISKGCVEEVVEKGICFEVISLRIIRGRRDGAYVCFYLVSLKTGIVEEVDGISIDEDDFSFVQPVVEKYYPDFCLWDMANPLKRVTCNEIARELEAILNWMKTGVAEPELAYYIKCLGQMPALPPVEVRIAFFEELIKYMWEQEAWLHCYDFLNLEGF